MTELIAGIGSLVAGAATLGGWYLLRARRDNLDALSDATHIESLLHMWDSANKRCHVVEMRNEELELQHRRCHDRKRRLEAIALEHGVPLATIQEALK